MGGAWSHLLVMTLGVCLMAAPDVMRYEGPERVVGLYVSGRLTMPYLDGFRFAFYLLVILLGLTVGFAILGHQYEGYDPTVRVP